jgi:hypothetical protein
MATLVISQGSEDVNLEPSNEETYFYRIGAGRVVGRRCQEINDSGLLNQIALDIRDEYTAWIYKLNQEFVSAGLVWEGTSLFFLSDISNKRHELFDTYNILVGIRLIKQKLATVNIDTILLCGMDNSFRSTMSLVFPDARIVRKSSRPTRTKLTRRIFADVKFFLEILLVIGINHVVPRLGKACVSENRRYFFSFYPQTFDKDNVDSRYRRCVESEDGYLVSIVADGMHQQVSPVQYWKNVKRLPSNKFAIIDEGIRIRDLFQAGVLWIRLYLFVSKRRGAKDRIFDIDISSYIQEELIRSISRITRLTIFSNALQRVVSKLSIRELVYIVFEYSLGRAMSNVLGNKFPQVKRTGFNHGEHSWRFLNYFLAKGEAAVNPPYLLHCPIPERVLAEDELGARIYRYNGYQNVEVMQKVHRLDHLKGIEITKESDVVLIVAGLHDGEDLAKVMIPTILENPQRQYLFRPHPRARNNYIDQFRKVRNVNISEEPIQDVLCKVGHVFVTYSGLGLEAYQLGLSVTLVHIPGRINWSKCLDVDEFMNNEMM